MTATITVTRWEPSDLDRKTVMFSSSDVLAPTVETQRLGTFSVESSKNAAVVLILPAATESPDTTVRIRLWQAAAERIVRAKPNCFLEFTCFT